MENPTIQLQEFLDGSLNHEAEAELLHRLSVSPERREILRSFMKQQSIISADRASIAVPYAAEQKLWAAIAAIPPVFETVMPTAVPTGGAVSSIGAFTAFKTMALASIALIVGLGSGYLLWHNSETIATGSAPDQFAQSTTSNSNSSIKNQAVTNSSAPIEHSVLNDRSGSNTSVNPYAASHRSIAPQAGSIEATRLSEVTIPTINVSSPLLPILEDRNAPSRHPQIAEALYFIPASAAIREPGKQYDQPGIGGKETPRVESFLERFDFSIQEAIGKQFPNNQATNTSMPIITNSGISLKYMLTPQFWLGASAGTANVTQKKLSKVLVDANDPFQGYGIGSDLVHQQTIWAGGLLEYRKPVSEKITMALNVGAAASSIGMILSGEFGGRFDITSDVGVLAGARVSRSNSNVGEQYDAIISDLISNNNKLGSDVSRPSEISNINVEFFSGIYLHF